MKKITEADLANLIIGGEDSRSQFKADVANPDALAAELVAMLNAEGGTIYIGIGDDGSLKGLGSADVRRINQMISNVAAQHVKNPVSVTTENVVLANKRVVIVVKIPEGQCKPYFDKNGVIWLKEGPDKRRAVSREEIRRFFQSSSELPADEQPTRATVDALDVPRFKTFFKNTYDSTFPSKKSERVRVLKNLNLADDTGRLNLAGLLLFGVHPEFWVPQFGVKAVRLDGDSLSSTSYSDSEDYNGYLGEMYKGVMAFVMRNLHKRQGEGGVNLPGESEIPAAVLEEVIVNALLHRDYFISAPIRVFVFDDRVEIISPGALPNHLTVEKILAGNTNIRNPVIASFVAKGMLPYHGLGSGIMRAKHLCPKIQFVNDADGLLFKAVIPRDGEAVLKTTLKTTLKAALKTTLKGNALRIAELIAGNHKITYEDIQLATGLSRDGVKYQIRVLKQKAGLVRKGGLKDGEWDFPQKS